MANTTFKGPVRSQNGFQEWNGTAWVPVAGGGGGVTYIQLVGDYTDIYGNTDNRYSDNKDADPPSGPTAGTFVQMPQMAVGDRCAFQGNGGSSSDVWAIKVPTIAGTDLSALFNNSFAMSVQTGDFPAYTLTTYWLSVSTGGNPVDTFYVYGVVKDASSFLEITRVPDITVPGFGVVAVFNITGIPITTAFPIANPLAYPYSQFIPAPGP